MEKSKFEVQICHEETLMPEEIETILRNQLNDSKIEVKRL